MLHDHGGLTCPRCGVSIEDFETTVSPDTSGDNVRIPVSCPNCDAPLAIVIESAAPDALGLDVWSEDRRDE